MYVEGSVETQFLALDMDVIVLFTRLQPWKSSRGTVYADGVMRRSSKLLTQEFQSRRTYKGRTAHENTSDAFVATNLPHFYHSTAYLASMNSPLAPPIRQHCFAIS